MKAQAESRQTLVLGVYAREFPGGLLKLDPALRMPSLLPHDLCHGRSSSLAPSSDRILVELFQILKDDAVESAALNMPANLENSAVGGQSEVLRPWQRS